MDELRNKYGYEKIKRAGRIVTTQSHIQKRGNYWQE